MEGKKKIILIVAAHPDDEILGCGGTVARFVDEGAEAYTLILGEGITSRDETRNHHKRKKDILRLRQEIKKANEIIGVNKTFVYSFPDNRFDTVALLDIVKTIVKIKEQILPDIIFTHYENDTNIDHQITYKSVLAATRPMENETVKELYSFEVLSSTEWGFPLSFSPDTFFNIDGTIDIKIKAMDEYESEVRAYPHPRSLKAIKLNAETWGFKCGCDFVEAFKTIRCIR